MTQNLVDYRSADRYLAEPPLPGRFNGAAATIHDLSGTGLQIEHVESMHLGLVSRLTFEVPRSGGHFDLRGLVIWSRLSRTPNFDGKYLYRSGIRLEGCEDTMMDALSTLLAAARVRLDIGTFEKKKRIAKEREAKRLDAPVVKRMIQRTPEISTDQILLIQHARERLKSHPDEAVKWYNRVKFLHHEEELKNADGARLANRDEALAVWEYLERTVELATITKVFESRR